MQDECEDGGILTNRMLRGYNIKGGTVRTAGSSFEGSPRLAFLFPSGERKILRHIKCLLKPSVALLTAGGFFCAFDLA